MLLQLLRCAKFSPNRHQALELDLAQHVRAQHLPPVESALVASVALTSGLPKTAGAAA
jgi:hypothetical protein